MESFLRAAMVKKIGVELIWCCFGQEIEEEREAEAVQD
jgi:hypothetical protein